MSRGSSKKAGASKIRFIMLEAELSEGDLSEVTSAIQNALKPKQPQVLIQQVDGEIISDKGGVLEDLDDLIFDAEADVEDDESSKVNSPRRKTTYRTPKVVEINFETVPTLQEYVAKHPPERLVDRHLVILGWVDEGSELDAVDVDQVYTAFRHLGWPSSQKDFSQPLRDLKRNQLITGSAKDGFKINHIGLGKVEKLASGG